MTESGTMEVALVVRELERSEAFYRDAFGFERMGDFSSAINRAVGLSRGGSVLKLIRYDDDPEDTNPSGRAYGLRFLTLEVDDVAAAIGRCRAAGGTVDGEAALFRPEGVPAASDADACWYVFALDPDGNRIEVRSGSPWSVGSHV